MMTGFRRLRWWAALMALVMWLGVGPQPVTAVENNEGGSSPAAPSNLTLTSDGADITLTWTDNSDDDLGFLLERRSEGGVWAEIAAPTPNLNSCPDILPTNGTYYYRVRAFNNYGTSDYTNVVSYVLDMTYPPDFKYRPVAPTGLRNTGAGAVVTLQWTDDSDSELGFTIQRMYQGGGWTYAGTTGMNGISFSDRLAAPGTYYYRVRAFNNFGPSAWSNLVTIYKPDLAAQTIVLKIGDPNMTVNGSRQEIDPGRGTAPVIVDDRTVLPIRAIVEVGGGTIEWEPESRKVTIREGGTVFELWIGSTALNVNGTRKQMDTTPLIINDRTMIPISFVVADMGAEADWDGADQAVTIRR
ncbi:MAG: stalk domain-containing protein [Syntrophomonadaceae bacterium]